MKVPVAELLSQLDDYLPIETASAQMKMEIVTNEVYKEFFKIVNLQGSYFCTKYHEEMQFGMSARNRSAGLEFFRLTGVVNPVTLHSYIKEPAFEAEFDLALPQTPRTFTSSRPSIITIHT
jgi:hypothetical protein